MPLSNASPNERVLEKRLADMEVMVSHLPGVSTPAKRRMTYSYADSHFVKAIATIEMPSKFTLPNMKTYDGTTDLDETNKGCLLLLSLNT